ncbi:DUF2252 domain-containing protein [Streptacidiphilus rugosus]|uniref:DUF2252 domain-containing protein n=1 Tax=Streptacidiphilus rugosus TaxID=405783 RepID=UPI000A06E34A|nr:DUF2252 domain-containing protein [Streptacidiphilus rugosus]
MSAAPHHRRTPSPGTSPVASPVTSPSATAATSAAASTERGRAARKRLRRSALGDWVPADNRVDPIVILEHQAASRVPELVPIRYSRMADSRFAFLRGAPAIMAADLAAGPHSGLEVQLCGDAHLCNFGLFAAPDRQLLFDLNDFDETLAGPFEWDVKRLAASVAVAARQNGGSDDEAGSAARAAARGYREAMGSLAGLGEFEVWYRRTDVDELLSLTRRRAGRRQVEQTFAQARRRTSLQALEKLTVLGADGEHRIVDDPPLVERTPRSDLAVVQEVFDDYRASLPPELRVLLDRHRLVDTARKVVGVGSVGTRCFIVLMQGRQHGDPLFLQVKEAEESVLARHLAPSPHRHQGRRVVAGQRLLQASGDIMLGWATGPEGRYFYLRQLRDMKGAADVETLTGAQLRRYAALCGQTLARGHARSGDRVALASYLGSGDAFDRAMGEFALRYAEQTAADHRALLHAIETGRVSAPS